MMSMKTVCGLAAILLLCVACTPAKQIVLPDREDVAFFERPKAIAAARRSGVPMPLVVLRESDPWAMVIGSDSPTFALYDDGTVIRQSGDGFVVSELAEPDRTALIKQLKPDVLRKWYGRFKALPGTTDQPDQDLLIYAGEKPIFISVNGSIESDEVRAVIPNEVLNAFDTLMDFKTPGRSWLPDYIEVMISPFDRSEKMPIQWPADFPRLDDSKSFARGDDQMSLMVPASRYARLKALLQKEGDSPVEIGGRKWSASIRFPFPQEHLWMPPNPEHRP